MYLGLGREGYQHAVTDEYVILEQHIPMQSIWKALMPLWPAKANRNVTREFLNRGLLCKLQLSIFVSSGGATQIEMVAQLVI